MNTLKKQLHDKIRSRLKKYRKECLSCLYPNDDYEWGSRRRKNVKNTLALINKIMRGISEKAWPEVNPNDWSLHRTIVASGNWHVKLEWEWGKRRLVDLKHRNNDHTGWVIEHAKKHGTYINYDIGGS